MYVYFLIAAVDQATQDVTTKYEEEQEQVMRNKKEVEEKLQCLHMKVSNNKYAYFKLYYCTPIFCSKLQYVQFLDLIHSSILACGISDYIYYLYRDGFLSTFAKSLQKKVGSGLLDETPENLEESMKKVDMHA